MNIRPTIAKYVQEAIQWRHAMHQNPGVAYDESFAGKLVKDKLEEWGLQYDDGWGYRDGSGGYGVVVTIPGNKGFGEIIGLRADMDALAITEETNLSYASNRSGLMHACGHDGHTATLLTVAKYFAAKENRNFKGTLKLIFQPAEEGAKGAKAMMEEGLFDKEKHLIDYVFAMHNWPDLPFGQIAVHPGPVMASSTYFDIDLEGKAAHVAKFDKATSAIKLAAEIISGFPQSHRNGEYNNWRSVELTHINAGSQSARGVIPAKGLLQGSIRAFNNQVLLETKEQIKTLTSQFRGTVNFADGSPATINNPEQAAIVRAVAQKTVGAENVIWDAKPELTAEDFGFMLQEKPGCYFWIGQGDNHAPNTLQALHNPSYDFNDNVIGLGAEMFVSLVEHRLG